MFEKLQEYIATSTSGSFLSGDYLRVIIGFLVIVLILAVIFYIYSSLALMAIARKTKTENGWLAWIPIAHIYLITQMAGISGWWTLIILAQWIPFIGSLLMFIALIWMFWIIAEKLEYPSWTSLLLIIPIVNLVILGMWAWSNK